MGRLEKVTHMTSLFQMTMDIWSIFVACHVMYVHSYMHATGTLSVTAYSIASTMLMAS